MAATSLSRGRTERSSEVVYFDLLARWALTARHVRHEAGSGSGNSGAISANRDESTGITDLRALAAPGDTGGPIRLIAIRQSCE